MPPLLNPDAEETFFVENWLARRLKKSDIARI
jgi:hypothetical protein